MYLLIPRKKFISNPGVGDSGIVQQSQVPVYFAVFQRYHVLSHVLGNVLQFFFQNIIFKDGGQRKQNQVSTIINLYSVKISLNYMFAKLNKYDSKQQ